MMAASPFLPTLAGLRNSEDCKTRQCVWTKVSRKSWPTERCLRTISDDGKTRKLLRGLNDTKDIRAVLADLAALQLCGRSHRKKHIGFVLDGWIREIEEERLKPIVPTVGTDPSKSSNTSEPTRASNQSLAGNHRRTGRATPTPSKLSRPVTTASVIRQILQIDEGDNLKCHGLTTRNSRCTKPLSRLICSRIDSNVKSLASLCSISSDIDDTRSLLAELAGLVLCQGYHQDQAPQLSMQWLPEISNITTSTGVDIENSGHDEQIHNPSTPNRSRGSIFDPATPPSIDDSPESPISSMWSGSLQSRFTTPDTSPHRSTSRETQNNSPLSPRISTAHGIVSLLEESDLEHSGTDFQTHTSVVRKLFTQQSSNARKASLRNSQTKSLRPNMPAFMPFSTQGAQKMLKEMRDMLSRPLSEQHQRMGYIYAFQREDNGYIKIGVTKDIGARMRQWANSCHYEPKILLQVAVPHAFRVERLIQLHLRNERFRESLVDGLCNSGRGCPKKHEEWFKIGLERCQKVINLWKRFMESEPYDEKHGLKAWWQQQLQKIQLGFNLDSWLHWLERILDEYSRVATRIKEGIEKLTGVKVERESEVKNLNRSIVANEEPDTEAALRETDQEQGFKALGRQYRMRIKFGQGPSKGNPSKGILGTALSLDGASLVGRITA